MDGGIVGFPKIYKCLQYSFETKSRFTSFISIFDQLQVTSVNLLAVSRTPYLHQEKIYYQTISYVSFHWQFVIAHWDLISVSNLKERKVKNNLSRSAESITTLLYFCVYVDRFIHVLTYLHIIMYYCILVFWFEFLSICKGRLKVILVRVLSKWCCLCIHKRWAVSQWATGTTAVSTSRRNDLT